MVGIWSHITGLILFPIFQRTLPWQPILGSKWAKLADLVYLHSQFTSNISLPMIFNGGYQNRPQFSVAWPVDRVGRVGRSWPTRRNPKTTTDWDDLPTLSTHYIMNTHLVRIDPASQEYTRVVGVHPSFLTINPLRQIISGSTGLTFSIFSPYGKYLIADYWSDLFPRSLKRRCHSKQFYRQNGRNRSTHFHSSPWHSKWTGISQFWFQSLEFVERFNHVFHVFNVFPTFFTSMTENYLLRK